MNEIITKLVDLDKETVKKQTNEMVREIGDLHYQMFAEKKHSILIILQGLDASGKDGLVRDLLEYCNPIGLSVYSFKKPTPEEYNHDFLWRVHKHAPPKGILQVFIRSHYEDILVPAVEGFFPAEYVEERFRLINEFERLIQHNGTRILKCYMSVSAEKQEERLRERITNPQKQWKHNDGDWDTLKKRDLYLAVYQKIFDRCCDVPWYLIPSDKNWQKTFVAASLLLETLRNLNLGWPPLETKVFTADEASIIR